MPNTLTVDIWSDVVCPWCAIGATQFCKAVEAVADDVTVEARFMPFELNPEMDPEGADQIALLSKAYGKTPEEVLTMRERILAAAEEAGFSMEWSGEGEAPPLWVWNTHKAHMLLRWALTQAEPARQVSLKLALLRAYFQQRRNISDDEVLLDIAEAEGFDRAAAAEALAEEALSTAVKLEERRALQNRISSVPTFVVAGKYILQGSAKPEEYAQALIKLASMEAMA